MTEHSIKIFDDWESEDDAVEAMRAAFDTLNDGVPPQPRTAAEAVGYGAAFLDIVRPGWWNGGITHIVNLDVLDIAQGNSCMCGQVMRVNPIDTADWDDFHPSEDASALPWWADHHGDGYQLFASMVRMGTYDQATMPTDDDPVRGESAALGFTPPSMSNGQRWRNDQLDRAWQAEIIRRRVDAEGGHQPPSEPFGWGFSESVSA